MHGDFLSIRASCFIYEDQTLRLRFPQSEQLITRRKEAQKSWTSDATDPTWNNGEGKSITLTMFKLDCGFFRPKRN